jgi:hypothetical protein
MSVSVKQSEDDECFDSGIVEKCICRELNDIFKLPEMSGDYLLDMSPTMSPSTATMASRRFKNIVFGKGSDDGQSKLVEWVESRVTDGSDEIMEYIKNLENEMDHGDKSIEDIVKRTRRSVKAILSDIFESGCWFAKFNCVLVVLSPTDTKSELTDDYIKRLVDLLGENAYLIICGSCEHDSTFISDLVQSMVTHHLDILRLSISDTAQFKCFSITATTSI